MKIGDKVICKKDHAPLHNEKIVIKDNTYEIIKISEDFNISNNKYTYITISSEAGYKNWSIDKNGPFYKFYEYFITLKEERKQKLDKINRTR